MNIRKIGVITNFRTGSTSFTLQKADHYGVHYGAELFSQEKANGVGRIPDRSVLQKGYKIAAYEILDLIQSHANLIEEINRPEVDVCFKVMPSQVTREELVKIANSCDKLYYLYRRDFRATVKSWIARRTLGDFNKTGFITESRRFTPEYVREVHLGHLGKGEKVIERVDLDDPRLHGQFGTVTAENLMHQIRLNYERMADVYKEVPGELVCYEDYFSGDNYNPYNVETHWSAEPDIIEFDVESLFTIDK